MRDWLVTVILLKYSRNHITTRKATIIRKGPHRHHSGELKKREAWNSFIKDKRAWRKQFKKFRDNET